MNHLVINFILQSQELISTLKFIISDLLSKYSDFLSRYLEGQRKYIIDNITNPLSLGYISLYLYVLLEIFRQPLIRLGEKIFKIKTKK